MVGNVVNQCTAKNQGFRKQIPASRWLIPFLAFSPSVVLEEIPAGAGLQHYLLPISPFISLEFLPFLGRVLAPLQNWPCMPLVDLTSGPGLALALGHPCILTAPCLPACLRWFYLGGEIHRAAGSERLLMADRLYGPVLLQTWSSSGVAVSDTHDTFVI